MSVESYRESPGKFDSRTLSRKTPSRWTGRILEDCQRARGARFFGAGFAELHY